MRDAHAIQIIKLPDHFVDYLNEDSIVLPSLPADQAFLQGYDPRINPHITEADTDCDLKESDSSDNIIEAPCFPVLEGAIVEAIKRLGGKDVMLLPPFQHT
jgi:hypothetical protein